MNALKIPKNTKKNKNKKKHYTHRTNILMKKILIYFVRELEIIITMFIYLYLKVDGTT